MVIYLMIKLDLLFNTVDGLFQCPSSSHKVRPYSIARQPYTTMRTGYHPWWWFFYFAFDPPLQGLRDMLPVTIQYFSNKVWGSFFFERCSADINPATTAPIQQFTGTDNILLLVARSYHPWDIHQARHFATPKLRTPSMTWCRHMSLSVLVMSQISMIRDTSVDWSRCSLSDTSTCWTIFGIRVWATVDREVCTCCQQ